MADQLLSSLFADGCSVDGGTSASNPITAILNVVLDSSAAFGPRGIGASELGEEGHAGFAFERSHYQDMNSGPTMHHNPMQMAGGGSIGQSMMSSMMGGLGGFAPHMHMPMHMPMNMPMHHMLHMDQMQGYPNQQFRNDQIQIQSQNHRDDQYQERFQEGFNENLNQDYELGEDLFLDESEDVEAAFEDFYANLHKDSARYASDSKEGEFLSRAGMQSSSLSQKSAWDSLADNLERVNSRQEEYEFSRENPLLTDANGDLQRENSSHFFEMGMRYFRGGEINNAINAFEAQVQADAEHNEAWRMLGTCYAEHDQDKAALICLKRAIEHDPFDLDTLLAMGISFVNELDSVNALQTLRSWVLHNPSFQGLQVELDAFSDGSLMDEVTQLMLEVQRVAPADADVKIILGVLYNVSQDYDLAAQLFNEALTTRQEDYSLHNKVGATLANGNRSSLAIPAYSKALSLRPNYARGWLNLGIAYANLSRYEDSSKAYLQALHLNPSAKHIWGYLRVVLTCMDRLELVELTTKEDIVTLATTFGLELKK